MTTTTQQGVPVVTDDDESVTLRDLPKPEFTDAEAGAREFPDSTARRYNYYIPQKRKQSHYEDVTVEVQPDPRHYLSQGWLYGFSDGRRRLPARLDRSQGVGRRPPGAGALPRIRWPGLRLAGAPVARVPRPERRVGADPLPLQRERGPADQRQHRHRSRQSKAFEQWNPNWVQFVERNVGAWMHVEHGLGLYLFANANRRAPTNMHNNAISVNSMHRIRFAQDLALYNLTLSEEIDGFDGAAHIETWNSDPAWQGVRKTAEQLTAHRRLGRGDLRRERRLRATGR